MVNITAEDLKNLANMVSQFDKLGARVNGQVSYDLVNGGSIPVYIRFHSDFAHHVMVFNPNVSEQ